MKIKLFWKNNPLGPARFFRYSNENASSLEDEINAWLREHPHIKVVDIKQSASSGSVNPSLWLISVWYEEGEDQPIPASDRPSPHGHSAGSP